MAIEMEFKREMLNKNEKSKTSRVMKAGHSLLHSILNKFFKSTQLLTPKVFGDQGNT